MDFKNFYFSYSSLNTFETCKYQFFLSYIDKKERIGNFFSDFGSHCHDVLEKFFAKELEVYELAEYYEKEYSTAIKNSPPPFIRNAWNTYYDAGLEFFNNIDFDRDEWQIVNVEDFIRGTDNEINLVIKPDLVLTNNLNHDTIIFDFKTSEIVGKNGKVDQEKLDGYKKQLNLYIYYIWYFKGIEIKKARLWFIRSNTFYEWEYDPSEVSDVVQWVRDVVTKIKQEKNWDYDNKNRFMCLNLCSIRNSCEYKYKK